MGPILVRRDPRDRSRVALGCSWTVRSSIAGLVAVVESDGRNELWKFFGLASESSLPIAMLDPDEPTMSVVVAKVNQMIDTLNSQV